MIGEVGDPVNSILCNDFGEVREQDSQKIFGGQIKDWGPFEVFEPDVTAREKHVC
jgi:hypothetical protein